MIHRERIETQREDEQAETAPGSGVAAVSDFAVGSVVAGKYFIEELIGEGGLGAVVKAKHLQLDQHVAIKYLKSAVAARPDIVERFLREARLAAKIKSEHAVKVQDVDAVESGIPYIVMEFLEGRDLERVLAEGPLAYDLAIDYVLQASEALAEAHAAGIVHRDVKPANLFLATRPGGSSIVKVLDFGISTIASSETPSQRRVTQVEERVGTPIFMSPEQLQADADVDARSDIWALGVALYELLSGKLPFDGPDLATLCVAILTKPPVPLSAVNSSVPPQLDEVVARCLQKDPALRYQNIAELAQDLAQIWGGDTPSRVMQISRVIVGAGLRISPPTPFAEGFEPLADPSKPSPASESAAAPNDAPAVAAVGVTADKDAWLAAVPNVVEDHVVAVFSNAQGKVVDEMSFLSIDEAYEYAASLERGIVRCDLFDEFEGVRGWLRATYVRREETGHWVPLLRQ
jgi:serine/threonine-protein kinase